MVTGLAAGIGNYLAIDPVWVRVMFVILAVMSGGLAIIAYFIGAIVVPEEAGLAGEQPRGGVEALSRGAGILFGVLLIGAGLAWLLAALDVEFNINLDIDWVLTLATALVGIGAVLVLSGGRLMRGPLIFFGVACLLLLGPVNSVGIPENGSAFASRVERVQSIATLEDDYSQAFGSLTLDLRTLELPEGTTSLTVNTAFGDAQVFVPAGAAVRVVSSGTFGSIEALGEESNGIGFQNEAETDGYDSARRRLLIDVNSAFGSVEVR
jgi:phage shock protein PspC (stress-responsive transcriptional regulator)